MSLQSEQQARTV